MRVDHVAHSHAASFDEQLVGLLLVEAEVRDEPADELGPRGLRRILHGTNATNDHQLDRRLNPPARR